MDWHSSWVRVTSDGGNFDKGLTSQVQAAGETVVLYIIAVKFIRRLTWACTQDGR
ncbi:hypothetical protein HYDPIDRAFT_110070 [Hydnomerulius pinastri MD-312]|nr:hypothetical protein HYDPIDRAFT_110070 [Hydnomerulius pinastri MD-312]